MKRLCVVPRWGGGPDSDFYPWLRRELQARAPRPFEELLFPEMPSPDRPTIDGWVGRLAETVGADPEEAAQTVLMGHSVGCQTVLRFLASLTPGVRFAGVLLVAAWFSVDRPWDTLRPWLDTPFAMDRAREAAGPMVVLLSDNDPFTSDAEANGRAWQERAGASVVLVPGARHFNGAEEPAVLSALLTGLRTLV